MVRTPSSYYQVALAPHEPLVCAFILVPTITANSANNNLVSFDFIRVIILNRFINLTFLCLARGFLTAHDLTAYLGYDIEFLCSRHSVISLVLLLVWCYKDNVYFLNHTKECLFFRLY